MRNYISVLLLLTVLSMADGISADAGGSNDAGQPVKDQSRTSILNLSSAKLVGEYYTNSSDFTRQSAGVEFRTSDDSGLHLGADYVLSNFSQDGFEDIVRHKVSVQGEKWFSQRSSILASLSQNFYDNENENLNGGLFIRYRPLTDLYTEYGFRHFDIIDTVLPFNNVIYSYVVTIGSLVRDIQSDDYRIYLLYTPGSELSFAGEIVYGDYSDDNEKRSLMFEAGYQWLDDPHLRTAYNYFYLDIKDPAPAVRGNNIVESAYWDPVNFETHTVRLEYRQDYSERISIGADAALSYCPKSGGLSEYAFLSLSYKLIKQTSLNFIVRWFDQDRGIDRLGETGRFRATNYNAALQYRF